MPAKTGFCYKELEQDRVVCLVPSSSALAGKEIVTMEELEQETILACNPLNAPAAIASLQSQLLNGRPAEKVVYCESVEVAHCLVSAGIGVVLLPSILSPNGGDLAAVPFAGGTQLSFGVFYKRKKGNRVLERLLKAI